MLPEATYTFTVPSIHDRIPLDCRIYHPKSSISATHTDKTKRPDPQAQRQGRSSLTPRSDTHPCTPEEPIRDDVSNSTVSRIDDMQRKLESGVRGAIIAHPYAPLGGSSDDPVVQAVGKSLLDCGFVVGTFNFRCVFPTLPFLSQLDLMPLLLYKSSSLFWAAIGHHDPCL